MSKNVITNTNTGNHCYICLNGTGQLVRPCNNNLCSARCHQDCLKKQVVYNKPKCGICQGRIVRNAKKINVNKCCKTYMKLIYVFLMISIGSALTIMNALGKTVATTWIQCHISTPCDDGAVLTILLTLFFFCMSFWQGHLWSCGRDTPCCDCTSCKKCCVYDIFCCGTLRSQLKYKSYMTIFIMFLISNSLICLAHMIGYPIIKHLYGKDDFFTWRTSLAGYVVYMIIGGIGIIGFLLYAIFICIRQATENEFGEINYGIVIESDIVDIDHNIIDIDIVNETDTLI